MGKLGATGVGSSNLSGYFGSQGVCLAGKRACNRGGVGFGSDRGKSLKGLSHEIEEGINHKVSLKPIN